MKKWRNILIYALQYLLKYRGYWNGNVDGTFGTMTYTEARNFQRANGLVVDGKVGTNTWNKIVYLVLKSTYSSKKNISLAAKYVLSARYGYRVLDYNGHKQ